MQLVEKRVIKINHRVFQQIDDMSFASKNLNNSANYNMTSIGGNGTCFCCRKSGFPLYAGRFAPMMYR